MKILFAASEAFPFCKTGGLADVLGSLPVALAAKGDQVSVVLPLYSQIPAQWRQSMTNRGSAYVDLGWRHQYCGLFSLVYEGVTWYFLDNEQYFHRPSLYGELDDGERFAFFSKAVVAMLPAMDSLPDVIHCNDWQTALVPVYLKDAAARWEAARAIKTVFTIHNIEYQGRFGRDTLGDIFALGDGWWDDGTMDMDGGVNLMKGAMLVADAVTTVSPTYASQLHDPYYAHGLHPIVDMIGPKLTGVLNGIDLKTFDPATDQAIAANYSTRRMAGKAECKLALQAALGLREDKDTPIIAMVTRLAGHKGVDLVCWAFDEIMATGAQMVVLGTGEDYYEDFFRAQASRYVGRAAACITYNEGLSHRIYAGSDLYLMPSRSEPCGLSQMIAMRYGSLPIVRETGGLKDTVQPYNEFTNEGNGFTFDRYEAGLLLDACNRAKTVYFTARDSWDQMVVRDMAKDVSWENSARQYRDLYLELKP